MSSPKKRKKASTKAKSKAKVSVTPKTGCWDDLKEVHRQCLQMMASPMEIFALFKNKQALAAARDTSALLAEAKIIQNDYVDYRHALEVIYEQHSERSGGTENPDELMDALMIGEKYQGWMHSFDTVISPTLQSIAVNLLNEPEEIEGSDVEEAETEDTVPADEPESAEPEAVVKDAPEEGEVNE